MVQNLTATTPFIPQHGAHQLRLPELAGSTA